MRAPRKLLTSALVVGTLGTVSAVGVFGNFSATTQNAGNEISTGTVALGDNDGGQAAFQITGAKPGDTWTRCIKVSYNGSLPADVTNYLSSTPGPLTPYLSLKLERGTQTTGAFPGCGDFAPAPTDPIVYDDVFMTAGMPRDPATALTEAPVGKTYWETGDSLTLRITLTLSASLPDNVQGVSSGNATVNWLATNR